MFAEEKLLYNPIEYHKRESLSVKNIGGDNFSVVISDLSNKKSIDYNDLKDSGYNYNQKNNDWKISHLAADYIYVGNADVNIELNDKLNLIVDYIKWKELFFSLSNIYPLFSVNDYLSAKRKSKTLNFVKINLRDLNYINDIKKNSKIVLVLNIENNDKINEQRHFFNILETNNLKFPVILFRIYDDIELEKYIIYSSGDFGSLLVDGLGDGIWIKNVKAKAKVTKSISFGILQACRVKISKTEYISCPSCGRTLFDIQNTLEKVRKRTKYFKGIKIAIMGCIVNGPGEMADADYGYIGGAKGKVNLYMKKKLIKQNIPEENAVEELLELIKKTKNIKVN